MARSEGSAHTMDTAADLEAIEQVLAPTTLFDPAFTFSPANRNEM